MSIALKMPIENAFIKIFEVVKSAYYKMRKIEASSIRGRKPKYSDIQMIMCMLYKSKNNIFSFRHLEYSLKRDAEFCKIIGLEDIPDYSTFSIRIRKIGTDIYYRIYSIVIEMLSPNTDICAIDATCLRSSKYDSEAAFGQGTRLGKFKGYKLHCLCTVTDSIIPLSFEITTANVYDNQAIMNLYDARIYEPTFILADAAYDCVNWFETSYDLSMILFTDVNMRKAKSIDSLCITRYINATYRESISGKKLYKNRLKIEQLFSVLKGQYNLENPRLYGKDRYELHIKGVLLSYIIDEYIKACLGIKSRRYPWNEECA